MQVEMFGFSDIANFFIQVQIHTIHAFICIASLYAFYFISSNFSILPMVYVNDDASLYSIRYVLSIRHHSL